MSIRKGQYLIQSVAVVAEYAALAKQAGFKVDVSHKAKHYIVTIL